MQAFHFRLERVLGWYRQQADTEQARLAGCLNELSNIEQGIRHLQSEQSRVEQSTMAEGSIGGQDLSALGFYRLGTKRRQLEMDIDLERSENAVSAQRERVQFARRRFRLVENLRERRFTAHTEAFDKQLEEVAAEAFLAKWTPPRLNSQTGQARQIVDIVK